MTSKTTQPKIVSETTKPQPKSEQEVITEPINETVEVKPLKPKRKCSEKQLAALAEGRKKNPYYLAKLKKIEEEKTKTRK